MGTHGMAAAVIATAALILAPAGTAAAQPAQPDGVTTIGTLEATGYDVIIDRVGSAPLDQCIVTSVRNPQERTRTFWTGEGKNRERVTVVVSRSITVSLNCDV